MGNSECLEIARLNWFFIMLTFISLSLRAFVSCCAVFVSGATLQIDCSTGIGVIPRLACGVGDATDGAGLAHGLDETNC